jgi:hypothetical protein
MVNSSSFNRAISCGVLLLSALPLSGCEGLAVHDVSSLLVPEFQRSELIGLVAGFGTTFAAVPDLLGVQAAIEQGHQPDNGRYHRRLSDRVGLLWSPHRVTTGDCLEHDRRGDQSADRGGLPALRPPRGSSRSVKATHVLSRRVGADRPRNGHLRHPSNSRGRCDPHRRTPRSTRISAAQNCVETV